jgi:RNA polymerase sigma-70 factor (ECF subfamily)
VTHEGNTTAQLQALVDRLRSGDTEAREQLIAVAHDRLVNLTRRMKKDYPGVARFEQTEDVFQNAAIRLCRTLEQVQPNDADHFLRLAALQIRRELIDLSRHYQGPRGLGANHATQAKARGHADTSRPEVFDPAELSHDPQKATEWGEFHETVEKLPEECRQVFDLLWYHGMSQQDAAKLLQVDVRTVKRRWRDARLELHRVFGGSMPGEE